MSDWIADDPQRAALVLFFTFAAVVWIAMMAWVVLSDAWTRREQYRAGRGPR